jgi:hypothetical protein
MEGAAFAASQDGMMADDGGAENFRATLRRAQLYAEEQGHRQVTLEHLLLALTEDPDALAVFEASRIDVDRLRDDVAGYVSRIPDRVSGEGGEPMMSPDLSKVVDAARQAAQQSRRQVVNGAIVLAALIGEGRSPAAEFLKTHGLTFEEAIRTLQARAAAPAPAAAPARPAKAEPPTARPEPARPAPAAKKIVETSSDDDILASIRSEMSQEDRGFERTRPPPYEPPPAAPSPPPLRREPPLGPYTEMDHRDPAEPRTGRPAMSRPPYQNGATATPPTERMRAPPPQPLPGAPGWRPPGPPPAGATARPPMGPPPHGTRPPYPAGPPGPMPSQGGARPAGPRPQAQGARPPLNPAVSEGTLLENIPRRMRVGTPEQVEVRIARSALEGLGEGMHGQVTGYRVHVAKAMAVRLRAPEGGFYIEPTSPETQWIENTLGIVGDDFASWRWTVTPHYSGKARLQLVVSARSVGPDGLAAETALPEQVIEVRVSTNYGRTVRRIVLWLAAMGAAGIIGAMGEAGFRFFTTIIGG